MVSNYILTRMEKEGVSFEEVLTDARELGYVEADEALDLDGVDGTQSRNFGLPCSWFMGRFEGNYRKEFAVFPLKIFRRQESWAAKLN